MTCTKIDKERKEAHHESEEKKLKIDRKKIEGKKIQAFLLRSSVCI